MITCLLFNQGVIGSSLIQLTDLIDDVGVEKTVGYKLDRHNQSFSIVSPEHHSDEVYAHHSIQEIYHPCKNLIYQHNPSNMEIKTVQQHGKKFQMYANQWRN